MLEIAGFFAATLVALTARQRQYKVENLCASADSIFEGAEVALKCALRAPGQVQSRKLKCVQHFVNVYNKL